MIKKPPTRQQSNSKEQKGQNDTDSDVKKISSFISPSAQLKVSKFQLIRSKIPDPVINAESTPIQRKNLAQQKLKEVSREASYDKPQNPNLPSKTDVLAQTQKYQQINTKYSNLLGQGQPYIEGSNFNKCKINSFNLLKTDPSMLSQENPYSAEIQKAKLNFFKPYIDVSGVDEIKRIRQKNQSEMEVQNRLSSFSPRDRSQQSSYGLATQPEKILSKTYEGFLSQGSGYRFQNNLYEKTYDIQRSSSSKRKHFYDTNSNRRATPNDRENTYDQLCPKVSSSQERKFIVEDGQGNQQPPKTRIQGKYDISDLKDSHLKPSTNYEVQSLKDQIWLLRTESDAQKKQIDQLEIVNQQLKAIQTKQQSELADKELIIQKLTSENQGFNSLYSDYQKKAEERKNIMKQLYGILKAKDQEIESLKKQQSNERLQEMKNYCEGFLIKQIQEFEQIFLEKVSYQSKKLKNLNEKLDKVQDKTSLQSPRTQKANDLKIKEEKMKVILSSLSARKDKQNDQEIVQKIGEIKNMITYLSKERKQLEVEKSVQMVGPNEKDKLNDQVKAYQQLSQQYQELATNYDDTILRIKENTMLLVDILKVSENPDLDQQPLLSFEGCLKDMIEKHNKLETDNTNLQLQLLEEQQKSQHLSIDEEKQEYIKYLEQEIQKQKVDLEKCKQYARENIQKQQHLFDEELMKIKKSLNDINLQQVDDLQRENSLLKQSVDQLMIEQGKLENIVNQKKQQLKAQTDILQSTIKEHQIQTQKLQLEKQKLGNQLEGLQKQTMQDASNQKLQDQQRELDQIIQTGIKRDSRIRLLESDVSIKDKTIIELKQQLLENDYTSENNLKNKDEILHFENLKKEQLEIKLSEKDSQIFEMTTQISIQDTEIRDLKSKNQRLEENGNQRSGQVQELKDLILQYQKETEKQYLQLTKSTEERESLKQQQLKLQDTCNAQLKNNTLLQRQVESLKTQNEKQIKELGQQKSQLELVKQWEIQHLTDQETLKNLKFKLEGQGNDLTQLKQENSEISQENNLLQNQIQDLTKQILLQEGKTSQIRTQNIEYENQISNQINQLYQLEQSYNQSQQNNINLSKMINELKNTNSNAVEDNNTLRKQITQLTNDNLSIQNQIAQLGQTLQYQSEEGQTQSNNQSKEIQLLKAGLNELGEEKKQLIQNLLLIKNQNDDLQDKMKALQADFDDQQQKLLYNEGQVGELNIQIQNLREEFEQEEQANEKLKQINQELEIQINDQSAKIAEILDQKQKVEISNKKLTEDIDNQHKQFEILKQTTDETLMQQRMEQSRVKLELEDKDKQLLLIQDQLQGVGLTMKELTHQQEQEKLSQENKIRQIVQQSKIEKDQLELWNKNLLEQYQQSLEQAKLLQNESQKMKEDQIEAIRQQDQQNQLLIDTLNQRVEDNQTQAETIVKLQALIQSSQVDQQQLCLQQQDYLQQIKSIQLDNETIKISLARARGEMEKQLNDFNQEKESWDQQLNQQVTQNQDLILEKTDLKLQLKQTENDLQNIKIQIENFEVIIVNHNTQIDTLKSEKANLQDDLNNFIKKLEESEASLNQARTNQSQAQQENDKLLMEVSLQLQRSVLLESNIAELEEKQIANEQLSRQQLTQQQTLELELGQKGDIIQSQGDLIQQLNASLVQEKIQTEDQSIKMELYEHQVENLKENLNSLKQQIQFRQDEINLMKTSLSQNQQVSVQQQQAKNEEVIQLQNEIHQLKAQNESLQEKHQQQIPLIEENNNNIYSMNNKISQLQKHIHVLEQESEQENHKFQQLTQQFSELNHTKSSLEDSQKRKTEEINIINNLTIEQKEQIELLNTKLSETELKLNNLNLKCSSQEKDIEQISNTLTNTIKSNSNIIDKQHNKLYSITQDIFAKKEEIKQLNEQLKEWQSSYEQIQLQFDSLSNTNSQLEENYKNIERNQLDQSNLLQINQVQQKDQDSLIKELQKQKLDLEDELILLKEKFSKDIQEQQITATDILLQQQENQQQINNFLQEIREQQNELAQKNQQLEVAELKINQHLDMIANLNQNLEDLKQTQLQNNQHITTLTQKNNSLNEVILLKEDTYLKTIESLNDQFTEATQHHQEEKKQHNLNLEQKQQEIFQLEERLYDTAQTLQQQMEDLTIAHENAMNSKSVEINNLMKQLEGAQKKTKDLIKVQENLLSEKEQLQKQKKIFEDCFKEEQENVVKLQEQMNSLFSENERLKMSKLSQIQNSLENESLNDLNQYPVSNRRSQIGSMEVDLNAIDTDKERIGGLELDLQMKEYEVTEMQSKIDQQKMELNSFQFQNQTLSKIVTALQEKIQSQQIEIKQEYVNENEMQQNLHDLKQKIGQEQQSQSHILDLLQKVLSGDRHEDYQLYIKFSGYTEENLALFTNYLQQIEELVTILKDNKYQYESLKDQNNQLQVEIDQQRKKSSRVQQDLKQQLDDITELNKKNLDLRRQLDESLSRQEKLSEQGVNSQKMINESSIKVQSSRRGPVNLEDIDISKSDIKLEDSEKSSSVQLMMRKFAKEIDILKTQNFVLQKQVKSQDTDEDVLQVLNLVFQFSQHQLQLMKNEFKIITDQNQLLQRKIQENESAVMNEHIISLLFNFFDSIVNEQQKKQLIISNKQLSQTLLNSLLSIIGKDYKNKTSLIQKFTEAKKGQSPGLFSMFKN